MSLTQLKNKKEWGITDSGKEIKGGGNENNNKKTITTVPNRARKAQEAWVAIEVSQEAKSTCSSATSQR